MRRRSSLKDLIKKHEQHMTEDAPSKGPVDFTRACVSTRDFAIRSPYTAAAGRVKLIPTPNEHWFAGEL